MAYESNLLTLVPSVCAVPNYTFSAVTSGLSATLSLSISGTTLGTSLPDEDCKLILQTSYAPSTSAVNTLSATIPGVLNVTSGSVYLSLSSATLIPTPIQYAGSIILSTLNTGISSTTLTLNFPVNLDPDNVNLQNTTIYLSGNSTTMIFDPTKNTTLDNFFFVSSNPSETAANKPNTIRTTSGHARLVAHLG